MLEACDLITCGVAARPKYVDDGVPFLSAKNVKNGQIIYKNYNCITKENHQELTKKNKPLKGDIIYTRVGSYGEAAVIEKDIEFSVFVSLTLIKPKQNLLNSYFLKYYLNSHEIKTLAKKSITSSGVGNLNVGTVRKFPINLPPLPEQTQIVTTLDKAFKQIDQAKVNLEKNLNNAKELFQSKLNEVFSQRGEGWMEFEINEICESIVDCVNKTAPSIIEVTPFKMIRTTNIRFGKVNLDKVKYVTEETYQVWIRRQKPKRGDLLFTREAPMGEIGMLLSDDNVFLGQRIVSYRIDEKKANSFFVLYAFQSTQIQEQVKELGSGATVQHLRVPHTKGFKLLLPSLKIQNEIVNNLTSLKKESERLQTHYQQKLNNLEELKKSILQKAFRGE
jgi:type I restriction enzyme S subunit